MKELSIEEKAKRYDKALGKARRYYDEYKTRDNILCVEDMEDMFPELQESENERIRKEIIKFIKVSKPEWENYRDYSSWIAWLEKKEQEDKEECEEGIKMQYEQKNPEESLGVSSEEYNKIVDECIYGDSQVIDNNAKMFFFRALERVEEQNAKGYKLTDCDKNSLWGDFKAYCGYSEHILSNSAKTCKDEQKPSDKVEHKFKVGDEIKTTNEESLIITKIDEEEYWSEDLFICDFDEECTWDLVEHKPAWSEEDENHVR